MISEGQRRAYLRAMQVDVWLPCAVLPFAAPSRTESLDWRDDETTDTCVTVVGLVQDAAVPVSSPVPAAPVEYREVPPLAEPEPVVEPSPLSSPPRFTLQLLRSGDCLLLVELPTGEPFQSRDPAYILLRDLLHAAGLPDSPQWLGEPIHWPLLRGSHLDQGPQAARDFVQSFVTMQIETQSCACLWLVGAPALRFMSDTDTEDYLRPLHLDGIGIAWALPGLEQLMSEPERKPAVWQAMQRIRQHWMAF